MRSATTFRVRPATAADAPAIAEQYAALHRDQWEGGGAEPPRADHEPDWLSEVVAALEAANARIFVADAEGRVIGTARVELAERPYFRIADIRRVYVVPDWRRRGVATQLMRVAEQAARDGGAKEARLSVVAENAAALRLYEALGYGHFAVRLAKRI
ncbi:MAG TPA: GNAT family N-acetyltransferase [Candidatus Limnocylindria bacterium]